MTAEEPGAGTRRAGTLPAAAYREIVDSSAATFLVLDTDGEVTYAGGSVCDLLGWEPSEIVGRNMADFLAPDQIALAVEALSEVSERGRSNLGVPIVFSIRRRDGSHGPVEIGAVPFLDAPEIEGTVIRLRDWTEQHHLDEFFAALVAERPLEQMLDSLSAAIAASLSVPAAAVVHGFDGAAFAGISAHGIDAALLPLDRGPWCAAVREGAAVAVDARDLDPPPPPGRIREGSCWVQPVHDGTSTSAAVIAFHLEPGPPYVGHRRVFERVVRYVQLALTRRVEHERLERLAGTDPLTGAPNRAAFRDRLGSVLDGGRRLTVAYCDLDGFKPVNDSHGHLAGDAVLVEVVQRLRGAVRPEDLLARFGGDEFTILFCQSDDEDTARIAGERLIDAMRAPFTVAGTAVRIGISVGLAMSRPGDSADALLARADAALYDAKRAGGGCLRVMG